MALQRYTVSVAGRCHATDTVAEACTLVNRFMPMSKADIARQLEASGVAEAKNGDVVCQVTDLLWVDEASELLNDRILAAVRQRFAGEPRIEMPENPVVPTASDYIVDVWFWVSESDAAFPEHCDDPDTLERCYAKAATHPDITFDRSPDVIFHHSGALVCGVVRVPLSCTCTAS